MDGYCTPPKATNFYRDGSRQSYTSVYVRDSNPHRHVMVWGIEGAREYVREHPGSVIVRQTVTIECEVIE